MPSETKQLNNLPFKILLTLAAVPIIAIIGVVLLTFFDQELTKTPQSQPALLFSKTPLEINTKTGALGFTVEVADTPAKQQQGLMFRDSLEKNSGMLFIFSSEEQLSFWMKNTKISLDMLFINSDKKIIHIEEEAVPYQEQPTYDSHLPSRYVLEVNAGTVKEEGIAVGDTISF